MPGAVAAFLAIGNRHAVVHDPDRMTYLGRGFISYRDWLDSPCRADFGAMHALGPAITSLVRHFGLHQMQQVSRGPQDTIGAIGHAKLAAGAVLGEMPGVDRAGRQYPGSTVGHFLVFNHRQTAIHFLFLGFQGGRSGQQSRGGQEFAAGGIHRSGRFYVQTGLCRLHNMAGIRIERLDCFPILGSHPPILSRKGLGRNALRACGKFPLGRMPVMNRVLGAFADAIHAGHATAVVYLMVGDVDARGLAVAFAEFAADALGAIDDGLEPREAGQEAEQGSDRAYRVAIGAAVAPCQDNDNHESSRCNQKGRQAFDVNLDRVESVASGSFGKEGQQVVAPAVNRGEKIGSDAAVGGIGVEQGYKGGDAADQSRHEQDQNRVSQPGNGFGIGVAVLFLLLAEPGGDVLEYAQGANDRAIDPAEKQGEQKQEEDDPEVQSQHGRQELYLGHPAEIQVQHAGNIEEQQRQQAEEHDSKRDSDFP